ncbi:MAG: hypothetical protein JSS98_17850 [Bacteroidetes bacterium]|nr:hypothetical protein [Bacteroidota bacterium]
MSYDLYFYKQKGTNLSETDIANYLTENLVLKNEHANQWFYENEDTEVYYSFDQNEPEEDPESIELYESFADFDNTHFSFNLNFMRPSFFGLEAFQFLENILADLNLFVLNPQSDFENPTKATKNELFENWNKTNLWASRDHYKEMESCYLQADKSNEIWDYNFNRNRLQKELGEQYFVPKIFFFKRKQTNDVVTVTSWTEHIPIVIPPADYFLLTRHYKKLFRTIKDNVLVSRQTIINNFGSYFNDFEFQNCKIIHPNNAASVKDKFNSIKSEKTLTDFAERLPMENLYNAKPD